MLAKFIKCKIIILNKYLYKFCFKDNLKTSRHAMCLIIWLCYGTPDLKLWSLIYADKPNRLD